jgi:hypothetical protein
MSGAGKSIILAVAVATCETRRACAYNSGAHTLIIATSASRAEHPGLTAGECPDEYAD